jgi:hypothetical protein
VLRRNLVPEPDTWEQAAVIVKRITQMRASASWEVQIDRLAVAVSRLPDVRMTRERRRLLIILAQELLRKAE